MDELDAGAKRKLLGELRQLHSLLHDDDQDALAAEAGPEAEAQPHRCAVAGSDVATDSDADIDVASNRCLDAEPPLLEDFVDPQPTEFEPAASEDTDWNQFVDQVFAQTSGMAHGLAVPSTTGTGAASAAPAAASLPAPARSSSTGGARADEDELMVELTRRLDTRLAALRATMLAELEAMLERRGRLR